MATGASTADVAIVLIDAKAFVKAGGLLPQSRRHTYIASLLRIPHVVAAVNKMDLVDYSEEVFEKIRGEFGELAAKLGLKSVDAIPVSALVGDNVVECLGNMPWYKGPTLLEYLETVPLSLSEGASGPLRFPVQLVVRPDAEFRGFAGRVERGELRPGLQVRALPSGRVTRVKSLVTFDGELKSAIYPRNVTVELEDEIDLSRGEMLIAESVPQVSTAFRAMVVWMHEQPLVEGRTYLAKHTTRTVRATVRAIRYRVDVNTAEHREAGRLEMNDIAEVAFDTSLPLFFDAYAESREMGSLILIDPVSNATVGAAMIVAASEEREGVVVKHAPALVLLAGRTDEARALVEQLRGLGHAAVVIDDALITESALAGVVRALQIAGVTAISARQSLSQETLRALREVVGDAFFANSQAATAWLGRQA
jgi:bifunctional enzyme CysN/CysC/sulfate adenylyltransferase subunit 1